MILLLTGATGFVGRNVLLAAAKRFPVIYVPVRNPAKLETQLKGEKIPGANIHVLPAEPQEWPPEITPTHAVHAAGVLFGRTLNEYIETNVGWTQRLLAALPYECRVTVLSSLSAGGPTPKGKEARGEEDADLPITWYGESKLKMEQMIRSDFPDRSITILRPPMILGPRDTATIPLFKMAGGFLRTKPGLKAKTYSWIGIEHLVEEIFRSFEVIPDGPMYVADKRTITDWQLIAGAAEARGAKGVTIPIPQPLLKLFASVVDVVPALRVKIPSLTKDRVREIWPDRWVVNCSKWQRHCGPSPASASDLLSVLRATWKYEQSIAP